MQQSDESEEYIPLYRSTTSTKAQEYISTGVWYHIIA